MPVFHFPSQIIISFLHKYKVYGFIQIHAHIYSSKIPSKVLQSFFILFSLGTTHVFFMVSADKLAPEMLGENSDRYLLCEILLFNSM